MRLIKSTAIIGAMTLISRVLGLVRDILLANYLGASVINDALITATKLPNLFRRMFAEGAFNAAFVPLYSREIEGKGDEAAAKFAGEVFAALLVFVMAIVLVFELTMPWSLNLVGGGLGHVSSVPGELAAYDLAVIYARITMPYLLLMSLAALFSGMLNARHYFAMAAFVPALLNVFWIGILILAMRGDVSETDLALYLAIGMTVSGVTQAGALWWALKRAKISLPRKMPKMTPGVKRLIVLGVPGLISAGITQINLAVSHSIATIKEGAASWLYYADRLYQLPLAMIGIAMGIALLPTLSRRLRAGDEQGAMNAMNRGMEIAAFLTVPAAVALFVMPEFLIGGLLERGQFTGIDTRNAGQALAMFALGLPAFVLLKVLTPAFFARENTKTPMVFAGMSALINLALGASLFFTIGFSGLALATSVAAWINVICLAYILYRDGWFRFDKRLQKSLPRIILASVTMGAALWLIKDHAISWLNGPIMTDYLALLLVCAFGGIIYILAAFGLRAFVINDVKYLLKKPST
ncbi:MAG: murein biosynthesis integral membrane protein MurJ [Maricaulaceae bacterium]